MEKIITNAQYGANKKFTKKSYLTSFTGFTPEWDAEIGKYNIKTENLIFIPTTTLGEPFVSVRSNKETKQKIVIFNSLNLILQPRDFIIVEGGFVVKRNAYMLNKLEKAGVQTLYQPATLQFDRTGFQLMWDIEKSQNGGNN